MGYKHCREPLLRICGAEVQPPLTPSFGKAHSISHLFAFFTIPLYLYESGRRARPPFFLSGDFIISSESTPVQSTYFFTYGCSTEKNNRLRLTAPLYPLSVLLQFPFHPDSCTGRPSRAQRYRGEENYDELFPNTGPD